MQEEFEHIMAGQNLIDEGNPMPVKPMKTETERLAGDAAFENDEFEQLMSLALDNRLGPEEAARFEAMLAEAAEIEAPVESHPQRSWAVWQEMDAALTAAPHLTPRPDFTAGVMRQLALQERRKRLWLGSAIGIAAILLWGTALLSMVGLYWLFVGTQPMLLGGVGENVVYWWTVFAGFVESALRSIGALLATAQARAMILVYCTIASGMLGLWWVWLRRTTHLEEDPSLL